MIYEIYYVPDKEVLKYTARSWDEKEKFVREIKEMGFKISRIKKINDPGNKAVEELRKEMWQNHFDCDGVIKRKLIRMIMKR